MVFLSIGGRKTLNHFYSVKAVHSGNIIYFPLFVKCDICDILLV